MCSIAVNDASLRQALREHLRLAGIETRPLFYPSHTLPHCATGQSLPVAESLSARGLSLPSYPALEREQVDLVTATIQRFF
jgi:perosamine synthetase